MAHERETESVSSVKFVVDKISFVNKLPMLSSATSDDAKPTAGYLYKEIANISYDRGSFCSDLVDYLVTRLEKPSCHVKVKVLRIMRYLVDNGHIEFTQALRRKAHGIREATKFGGPPDPLHGNAPYILVRKEAKELSSVLFETYEEPIRGSTQKTAPMTTRPVGGMGSSSSGGLQGFGNVPVKERGLTESVVGGIKSLADRLTDTKPERTDSLAQSQERQFSSYKPVYFPDDSTHADDRATEAPPSDGREARSDESKSRGIHNSQNTQNRQGRRIQVHRPGRAGGGWEDSDDDNDDDGDNREIKADDDLREMTPEGRPLTSRESPNAFIDTRDPQEKTDEDSAERTLVSDLVCQDEFLLKRKDLENFMTRCPTLNCGRLVQIVSKFMEGSSSQHHMHCLQVIETLLRTDLVTSDDIASTCCRGLEICCGNQDQRIKTKARKVIRILEKLCCDVDSTPLRRLLESIVLSGRKTQRVPPSVDNVQSHSDTVSNFSFISSHFSQSENQENTDVLLS